MPSNIQQTHPIEKHIWKIVPPGNESFYIKEMVKLMEDESLYIMMAKRTIGSVSAFWIM